MEDRDEDQFDDVEDCGCNTMNWPKAISIIVQSICVAAVLIAMFKYC